MGYWGGSGVPFEGITKLPWADDEYPMSPAALESPLLQLADRKASGVCSEKHGAIDDCSAK
ncbi:hypothetical protein CH63R_14474 [Colletotrichum higginsianum IMI 349063]|uniref:Uncharacterized protein n=1 Tax=Colletotrichum higginsianum (strain IMI 349063) TaxID=759273 RepID=A0A1B7XQY7_COLHI|nr:hypothetical protein CH63R_14474 [Colletotrichum higginsianum IMI 349063]OBR02173.1 hypothetical protein CH63R_14474 [Colletotrichum higginsianum IMI 349063]